MSNHHKINYIEFPVKNITQTKQFFSAVFGWTFVDYGDEYCAINNAAIDGGFYLSDKTIDVDQGSALIVLYSDKLERTLERVIAANGKIKTPIFDFPGGRRFHFLDLNGNEYAVWGN